MDNQPLPWQKEQWRGLQREHRENRLAHALLLHGHAGLGKDHFARAFAQLLLCEKDTVTACGECHACRQFAAGTSADFFVLAPIDGKKTIGIDQVRELIASLTLTSHGAGRRIAVINPADAMTANAANSLLKTLEEPPGASMLVLISARPATLPATVRSRCRQVHFTPPRDERVAIDWLAQEGMDRAVARDIVGIVGRRPLTALALNTQADIERVKAIPAAARDIVLGQRNPVTVAEKLSKEPLGDVLEALTRWAASLVRSLFANTEPEPAARRMDTGRLFDLLDRLYEAERLRDTAVNPQLLLESILTPLPPNRRRGE